MRITKLLVENFRAIQRVELSDLEDMIVIAGPNGCGKSCVLDSIRLFKSVYGGYQTNEWQQWLGEFQINFQRKPRQMASLLRDNSRPAVLEADIRLSPDEKQFIMSNISVLLEAIAWKSVVPGLNDVSPFARGTLAIEHRAYRPQVVQKVNDMMPGVVTQLNAATTQGRFEIGPTGEATVRTNVLLELLFSSFYPKFIGLIDYHGSHRNYGREELGGINLNLDQQEDKFRTSSLYNYANKYANIKSEMAGEYVRQALIEKGGVSTRSRGLSDTLQELFKSFFPGKKYLGPVPTGDGSLSFPVEIDGGVKHDINDLSSGEKEVLFGYLRLRNSAPKHSVILLDEPELHLNPALIIGLPQFYHKNLGQALDNQIWLVTHSDAFLREAVGITSSNVLVLHMQHATADGGTENQLRPITAEEEFETTILDMVGDLAAYRPGAKIVLFEGENSDFDQKMVARLFPEIAKKMNFISGGNKQRVQALHQALAESARGVVPFRFYSVVDGDSDVGSRTEADARRHSWDVYHIENYLLEPMYISKAMRQLAVADGGAATPEVVDQCLKKIAESQVGQLARHRVTVYANSLLVEALDLGVNRDSDDVAEEIHRAVEMSSDRVAKVVTETLTGEAIRVRVDKERDALDQSLRDSEWKKRFKGRDILKAFVREHVKSIRYDPFRNLIISAMADAGYQPEGMKRVLEKIAADS